METDFARGTLNVPAVMRVRVGVMVTHFLASLKGVRGLAMFGNPGSKSCCSKTDFRIVVT